ncbi:hypothetical protein ACH5RR_000654 [Cinchona calisaya]|uniref:Uncharacterized protein n=1 Tax=Cinchona calisaya TaxID=153742 RepID=A0ABD3B1Z0_9GENT
MANWKEKKPDDGGTDFNNSNGDETEAKCSRSDPQNKFWRTALQFTSMRAVVGGWKKKEMKGKGKETALITSTSKAKKFKPKKRKAPDTKPRGSDSKKDKINELRQTKESVSATIRKTTGRGIAWNT